MKKPAPSSGSTRKAPGRPPPKCAKQCSCGVRFTREDLIHLRSLTPIGMLHASGDPVSSSIYCFTHTRWSCRSTFGLPVETFRDQLPEPVLPKLLAGTEACGGHCSKVEDLELCRSECALAPYRRFLLERLIPRK